MKSIFAATILGLALGTSAAYAAPIKDFNKTATQASSQQQSDQQASQKLAANGGSWSDNAHYKPHWRNHSGS